jgi:hypothetical protein
MNLNNESTKQVYERICEIDPTITDERCDIYTRIY